MLVIGEIPTQPPSSVSFFFFFLLNGTFFLTRSVPFLFSDDETQFKVNGSFSQQDIYGNKITKEDKIEFSANDPCISILGKVWEQLSTEDQHTNQGRHVR